MTGEVTLTGRVLPVGGVREKILAARRAGIKTVLIPRHNEKDLVEIPAEVKADLTLPPGRHARRRRAPALREPPPTAPSPAAGPPRRRRPASRPTGDRAVEAQAASEPIGVAGTARDGRRTVGPA